MLKTHYLIVGAGIAGVVAAETIRDVDPVNKIILISGEAVQPYCRPLIMEVLTGKRGFDDIILRDKGWYEAKNITLLTGDIATRLDPISRSLNLDSGETIKYEKLLITAGSSPVKPSIPGTDEVVAYTLYCLSDVERLKPVCMEGAKGLILGIGLIGLQAITALKELGVDIEVVEMMDKILPLILDKEAARIAQLRLQENGIKVHTGTTVVALKKVSGLKHPYIAVTDSGAKIGFDFLVLSTGMKPEISFLKDSGVNVRQGITVSPTLETSITGIFAAGDVVEYPNWIEERDEIHAHWVNAYRQGRAAGLSMAGMPGKPYEPVFLNSLNIFGLPIITMGASRIDDPKNAKVYVTETTERPAYTRIVVKEGRLIAATFINDIDQAGMLQYLMSEKVDVDNVALSLFDKGKEGLEFLHLLHKKAISGEIDWAASMDMIDKYRKDMKHTRWGTKK